jgi:hypothetical protein
VIVAAETTELQPGDIIEVKRMRSQDFKRISQNFLNGEVPSGPSTQHSAGQNASSRTLHVE